MTTTDGRRWVGRAAILLVAVPLLASLGVALASLVPDRLILDSLVDGVERQQIVNIPQVGISGRGVDVFSDCIALTMGLGDTDGGPATIWLRSPTLGSCDGALASLRAFRDGEGLEGGYEYFRYWHGYTVVSRPLVATVGVAGLRIVQFWAFLAVAALFARQLWRRHGAIAPIALLGPFLLTTDTVELARSLPHGVPALVAVIGAWALNRTADADDLTAATVAFLAGSAYVFVDLLTTPSGAWALATCSGVLAVADRSSGRRLAGRGVLVGAAWIVGWVWTWVAKWGIATTVVGFERVRASVGDAVDDRLAGERDYIDLGPFNAIEENLRVWLDHPLTWPVLIVVAIATAYRWRRADHRMPWVNRLIVAGPAALPLVWFEVLRNHSLVHTGFVYRSLGVTCGVLALALLVDARSLRGAADAWPRSQSATWEAEHAEHERSEDQFCAERDGGDGRDDDAHRLGRVEPSE